MPEIPKTEYVPPKQPVPQQTTPPAAPSYCELATYDAAILRALLPDFVRSSIPGWATKIECSEAEARRVLGEVLRRPEIVQATAQAARRWEAARPAPSDAAATRTWWASQPPPILSPDQWAAMAPTERSSWTAQVRAWIAAGPEPLSPETVWSEAVRYVQQHPTPLVAAGVGLLALVVAALAGTAKAAGKRGSASSYAIPPKRLPSVESELATYGYDRYDHLR